ncbi:hypothetical protein [Fowl aviadenovirus D]|uniref:Uncharacterized protein n=1 Tax=Fowl aviadenovirus D TaxID=190064 RepID=A0A1D8BAZ6_9ADEN|nr:hypothetical protein [Fowl aviadenovirus D]BDB16211.1 hypothetical protein [Fowl aviadenovirus D]
MGADKSKQYMELRKPSENSSLNTPHLTNVRQASCSEYINTGVRTNSLIWPSSRGNMTFSPLNTWRHKATQRCGTCPPSHQNSKDSNPFSKGFCLLRQSTHVINGQQ